MMEAILLQIPLQCRPCNLRNGEEQMKLKIIIHEAEEGGYWAEVPAIPGCMTQGETMKDLIENLYDAIEGCLSIDMKEIRMESRDTVMELAV
jgi:predicted RNase H-like HicB family nuclease